MFDSGVYEIINVENGKKYIGSTVRFKIRWREHRRVLRKNNHNPILQHAWNKYGEGSFQFNIIERCSREELLQKEQYYLDLLKPEYNICEIAGSSFGVEKSEDHKKKISLALKNNKNCVGRKHSENTKKQIALSNEGKHDHFGINNPMYGKRHTEESKVKMRQKRLDNALEVCYTVVNGGRVS